MKSFKCSTSFPLLDIPPPFENKCEGTVTSKRGWGELGTLKTTSKAMASNFHPAKTYAIKQSIQMCS